MIMKLLCYNYLPTLCDYILDFPQQNYLKFGIHPLHNYKQLDFTKIKNNDKIFVKTDLLPYFFHNLFSKITVNFYLVTGVSDIEVDNKYLNYLNNSKIIKWIGVNISIQNNPKIQKMLIGFQEPDRSRNGDADGEGGDQEILYDSHRIKKKFSEKINKLFISYFNNTHSSRNNIQNIFKLNEKSNFVVFGEKIPFQKYLNELNNYKFVLCPRGNGIDTHRFSEILLMSSVPIIEKNDLSDLYSKFPCVIVNSFNEVTYELLNKFEFDDEKYEMFLNNILIDKINLNLN